MSASQEIYNLIQKNHATNKNSNEQTLTLKTLEEIRQSNDPTHLCLRTCIEFFSSFSSLNDNKTKELLFHCISGCKYIILKNWDSIPKPVTALIRDYFFSIGLSISQEKMLQTACWNVSCSFWKRLWVYSDDHQNILTHTNNNNEVLRRVLQQIPRPKHLFPTRLELLQYMKQNIITEPMIISFTSSFVNEFSTQHSTALHHTTLEFHSKTKKYFELSLGLNDIFQMTCQALVNSPLKVELCCLLETIFNWDFFHNASELIIVRNSNWNDYLLQPQFLQLIFQTCQSSKMHQMRQLLIQLVSLSGKSLFPTPEIQIQFTNYILGGTLHYVTKCQDLQEMKQDEFRMHFFIDIATLFSRVVSNTHRIFTKIEYHSDLLRLIVTISEHVLQESISQYQAVHGDIEQISEMEEKRRECLGITLEGLVLLVESGCEDSLSFQDGLSTLSNFYSLYIKSRIQICAMEEHYSLLHQCDLDEVREEISSLSLVEEMTCVSIVGRIFLEASLVSILTLFQSTIEKLKQYNGSNTSVITPTLGVCLEESRLCVLACQYLISDDNTGEQPEIPSQILTCSKKNKNISSLLVNMVNIMVSLTEYQTSLFQTQHSHNITSPYLSTTIITFWNAWAPIYIPSTDFIWNASEASTSALHFLCYTVFMNMCFFHQEHGVLDACAKLLISLCITRSSNMVQVIVRTQSFHSILETFMKTLSLTHVDENKNEASVQDISFQQIPYSYRSFVCTFVLLCSCDESDEHGMSIFNGVLNKIRNDFGSWLDGNYIKSSKTNDILYKEQANLCIEVYKGLNRTASYSLNASVSQLITSHLPQLANLMILFAQDLTICQALLELFRDLAETFISIWNEQESIILFQSCVKLIQQYSKYHFDKKRVILVKNDSSYVKNLEDLMEEERDYQDISCVIQLLIHMTAKDFIDTCSTVATNNSSSISFRNPELQAFTQVTDVIFFGLQQILPLMTEGLLQYPNLSSLFYSLLGFMTDTYPDKTCALPFSLFMSILDSLLYGMNNVNSMIAQNALRGVGEIAREHFKTGALNNHLTQNPELFHICTRRLLQEVVFQTTSWDSRLEPVSMTLLSLVAVDFEYFSQLVEEISMHYSHQDHKRQQEMKNAFEKLLCNVNVEKVSKGGSEGRLNRLKYKQNFEVFMKEIQTLISF